MKDSLDITIIHGSGSYPARNWYQWVANAMTKRGHTTRVPAFPAPEEQSLTSWMECFQSNVPSLGPSSVLIGHSTGAALILSLLNKLSSPIAGTFLAGGFVGEIGSAEYDPLNKSFFETAFDWPRVRENAGELFIYAGDNDPYVPLPKSIELAALLQSELVLLPGCGHLNYEADFLRFDRLVKDFDLWTASKQ